MWKDYVTNFFLIHTSGERQNVGMVFQAVLLVLLKRLVFLCFKSPKVFSIAIYVLAYLSSERKV